MKLEYYQELLAIRVNKGMHGLGCPLDAGFAALGLELDCNRNKAIFDQLLDLDPQEVIRKVAELPASSPALLVSHYIWS